MRQKKPSKENSERWLLTYSDMITLLMVLFVLLYAMSSVNSDKYEQLSVSLNSAFGGSNGILKDTASISSDSGTKNTGENGDASKDINKIKQASAANLKDVQLQKRITTQADMEKLKAYVDAILKEYKLGRIVSTSVKVTGLVITFPDNVFFDSGSDTLKDDMKIGLNQITVLFNKIDNSILIEGYTDNVPIIKGSKYASNWQLSALRASNVVQFLVDSCQIKGSRLSATGHGENNPVASNSTKEGKSKNRRIELTILYDSAVESQKITKQINK